VGHRQVNVMILVVIAKVGALRFGFARDESDGLQHWGSFFDVLITRLCFSGAAWAGLTPTGRAIRHEVILLRCRGRSAAQRRLR